MPFSRHALLSNQWPESTHLKPSIESGKTHVHKSKVITFCPLTSIVYSVSFQTCITVEFKARGKEIFLYPLQEQRVGCTYRNTQPLTVCFINLLNSCQVTPIFPLQRNCVASLRRIKSQKKISFPSYLFTSLFPSPTQSWQFSSASQVLISRILGCLTFLFAVRGEAKDKGLASHTAISSQSCVFQYITHKQTFVHYSHNR